MSKTVIIVRDDVALSRLSASPQQASEHPVEIVLDRRRGDRRRQGTPGDSDERRGSDRRVNIDAQSRLRREGFTVVHT